MNDTINSIMNRYSCRSFTARTPSNGDLQIIAKAAIASPSGMNRQPWQVIVVKNRELICEMDDEVLRVMKSMPDKSLYERIVSHRGRPFYNASCMVIVAIEPGTSFDCGILSENIVLAATSLGINSLICGVAGFAFEEDKGAKFKEKLELPDGYEIGIAILLGYAAEQGEPHEPDLRKIKFIV